MNPYDVKVESSATIAEMVAALLPGMIRTVLCMRSGGRGGAMLRDDAIREDFDAEARVHLRQLESDPCNSPMWVESVAVAERRALESALADPRAEPEPAAMADAESLRGRIRRGLAKIRDADGRIDRSRARHVVESGYVAARAATRGPVYAESFRRHLRRVIEQEIGSGYPPRGDSYESRRQAGRHAMGKAAEAYARWKDERAARPSSIPRAGDEGLTGRQSEILEFIESHIREHRYPPTVREIAGRFGIGSQNGALNHLKALRRKGKIEWKPYLSRSIRILGGCECPHCGGTGRIPVPGE